MSQISLQSAFDRISATLQRDRSSGYDDLKRILRQSRGNTEYILSARIHHNQDIFEALAGQIDSERAAYFKSFKSTSRSAGASTGSRLASASAAHRLALEVCVRDLKWRKVREILAHLTETFSSDEQDPICEPLALDNAKAINEILAYRPHLEHVPSKEWKSLVKFALAELELLAGQGSSDSAGRRLSGISNSSFALRTSRSHHSQTTKINSSLQKHLLAEFARLLRHLTSSSAAPIASHAPLVLTPLIETLQKAGVPGSTEVDLVAALNNVLTRSVTEAVTFIRNLTPTIVAIADALWARLPPRLIALKDELLSLMILLLPFIRAVTSHGTETSDVCQLVRNLADRLLKDYSSKAPKDLLGWDDLRLAPNLCNDNLHLPVFSLISSADESQRNWSTLILVVYLLDASSGDLVIGDGELPGSPRRKRMRRESRYSQLVRTAREPGLSKSIAGLQLIAFYCQFIPLPEQELFDVVQFIIPLLSDEDLTVTSWASFTLSRSVRKKFDLRVIMLTFVAAHARALRRVPPWPGFGMKSGYSHREL
ncbi:telomere-length maintenance and DNA damage repair-like protein [Elsinoe australis]|uniref:Telomere-length maintenance and DNA damage repair-like protein n=1 Tax=Elsinoe australis TaxID=40998 RepID=A0A4U7AXP3_9PEZI|nr:telomere-length maintenance and DNA damage repair-like protein [Elsinoe australis]